MKNIPTRRVLLGLSLVTMSVIVATLCVQVFAQGFTLSDWKPQVVSQEIICQPDTQTCPDGSVVTRSGIECEFAVCAEDAVEESTGLTQIITESSELSVDAPTCTTTVEQTLSLLESVIMNDIAIQPIEVQEDSRCPYSVQCIQAGTVKLLLLMSKDGVETRTVLPLGESIEFQGSTIMLTAVMPVKDMAMDTLSEDYRFRFLVIKQ